MIGATTSNGDRMNAKIANLCQAYDKAVTASRDPKRREKQDHYLAIVVSKRKAVEQMVTALMILVRQEMYDCDVSLSVAELAYFNAWFNLRGGWSG
jgi:hypothetical protein